MGRWLTAICLVGALIGLGAQAVPAGQERPAPGIRHTVSAGESLWSIARDLAPGEDPRRIVDAIIERNGLSSARIFPGQRLLLPPG